MFEFITIWFDKDARRARKLAFAFFERRYPALEIRGTVSLKRQAGDIMLAIAYSTGTPQRPDPYKVFLVDPVRETVAEVDLSKQPEYLIRWRK